MSAICLHFHLHIPKVLAPFPFFELGKGGPYIDKGESIAAANRFVNHTLLPASRVLKEILERNSGSFKVAFSASGMSLDMLASDAPQGLQALKDLTATGHVEWLNSPYFHSLSWLYDRKEFSRQLNLQREKIKELFGSDPQILCNTHLIYNNFLAYFGSLNGYKGILCEGVPQHLSPETENELCHPSDSNQVTLLLRNAALSEDISLRFSNIEWEGYPLAPETYATWLAESGGSLMVLSMDFNVFERHASSGILNFFNLLPEAVLNHKNMRFLLPSEAIEELSVKGVYNVFDTVSWDWPNRNVQSWMENPMQQEALEKIYSLGEFLSGPNRQTYLETWSALQASEIFSQMAERETPGPQFAGSPYALYASYMNMLADLQLQLST